jgi:phage head maturation protease
MPYKVQKDGSQYCVHKENADGSIGERVACHDSESSAEDQIKALYASERKMIDMETDTEMEDTNESDNNMDATISMFNIPDGKGLFAWADYVSSSWQKEVEEYELRYSYVNEIYSDSVIITTGYGQSAVCFRVPYTIEPDGEIEFDHENKQRVELKQEWVNKSFTMSNPLSVKAIGDNRIGGYAILWGNESRKDLDGQYFTKETEDLLTIFKAMGKIPWLVQHAADNVIKSVPVAEVETLEPDDTGLWFEAKVIAHDLYKKYVSRLIEAGKLFSSVGALPASVKSDKTGHISRFAVAELSGTWSPADPHQVMNGYSVSELKSHYEKLGIDNTDLLEKADRDESTTADQHDTVEVADGDLDSAMRELARNWLDLQKLQV